MSTIRATLQFLGINENQFIRSASATFKRGGSLWLKNLFVRS